MSQCPICNQVFETSLLEEHVNECLDNPPIIIQSKQPSSASLKPFLTSYNHLQPSNPINNSQDSTFYLLEEERRRQEEYERDLVIKLLAEEELQRRKLEERDKEFARQLLELEKKELQSNIPNSDYQCPSCSKLFSLEKMYYLENCPHMFCKSCLNSCILQKMNSKACSEIACFSCHKPINPRDIQELLSQEEYQRYETQSTQELIDKSDSFVRCPNPKCQNAIERVIGQFSKQKENGPDGSPLSEEAIIHKNTYRFRCQECSTEFCAQCKAIPYHIGFTCEKFKNYQKAKHCRFCAVQLTRSNTAPKNSLISDVCNSDECVTKRELSCSKVHACGHSCCGVKDEINCLRCLHENCSSQYSQNGEDLCNICWVEGLSSAPCIQLDCGHVFHFICAQKKIKSGWSGARVTFSFLDCALCKKRMNHPLLDNDLKPMIELYNLILKKAMQRLQTMGHDKAAELSDPKSKYYKSPETYCIDRYSYYICFKCHKPYFGGERACDAQNRSEEFNPEELVCGGCASSGKTNCSKHGNDYIEFKCKFCCASAVWFCWGTTHFCESCHSKASTIVNVPKDQLPKCTCGQKHPPNGEEYCFGCSMCILSSGSDY